MHMDYGLRSSYVDPESSRLSKAPHTLLRRPGYSWVYVCRNHAGAVTVHSNRLSLTEGDTPVIPSAEWHWYCLAEITWPSVLVGGRKFIVGMRESKRDTGSLVFFMAKTDQIANRLRDDYKHIASQFWAGNNILERGLASKDGSVWYLVTPLEGPPSALL